MRMRITTRLLAWAMTQLLLMAGTNLANTVDVVHSGYGAYDAITTWGGGTYGDDVAAGVYTLNKTAIAAPEAPGTTARSPASAWSSTRRPRPRLRNTTCTCRTT